MSCGCQTPRCAPANICPPENYGDMFPTLVGPPGPPGGPGTYVPTIALLRLLDPTSFPQDYLVQVLGYYVAGDGLGGQFMYSAANADPENYGMVIRSSVGPGAWLRIYSGPVNVRLFGAKGDGLTNDTVRITAARDWAAANNLPLFFPATISFYILDTLDGSGLPQVYGEGSLYGVGTRIRHSATATNDLFYFSDALQRAEFSNLWLEGSKETNLRNARTIQSVAGRLSFTVDSAPPASINDSLCFFFTALDNGGYRYLGTGQIQSVVGTTVTLASNTDLYSSGAANQPVPGWRVCFAQSVTEEGQTVADPTMAGYNCFNIVGLGSYLQLNNVRMQGFHVGIRRGVSVALDAEVVFSSKMNLAAMYCPFVAGSDDFGTTFASGGGYAAQDGLPPQSFVITNDPLFRNTAYGIYASGTSLNFNIIQLYQHRINFAAHFLRESIVDQIYANQSVFQSFEIAQASKLQIGSVVARGIGYDENHTYPVFNVTTSSLTIAQFEGEAIDNISARSLVESDGALSDVRVGQLLSLSGFDRFTNEPLYVRHTDPTAVGFTSGRKDAYSSIGENGIAHIVDLPVYAQFANRLNEIAAASSADQAGTTVTRTAGAFTFTSAHLNKVIVWGTGAGTAWAVIKSITSGTVVEVDRTQVVAAAAFTIVDVYLVAKLCSNTAIAGALISADLANVYSSGRIFKGYIDSFGQQTFLDEGTTSERTLVFLINDPSNLGTAAGKLLSAVGLVQLSAGGSTPAQVSGNIRVSISLSSASAGGTASQLATTVTRQTGTRDFTAADIGRIIRFTNGAFASIVGYTSASVVTVAESQTVAATGYDVMGGEAFAVNH